MRVVPAVHGRRGVTPDPPDELELADQLRREHSRQQLLELAGAHAHG